MPYTGNGETGFVAQHESTEAYEKSQGTKIERYMDDIYELLNEIIEKWALVEVADITALRALYDDANWDSSTTQHALRDLQIRKVVASSDGTNTFVSLYWFDEGSTVTDVDGATGNVDTDGIVSPLAGRATGRWLRIAGSNTTGVGLFVHQDGIEALRTMLKYLYVNLTAGSSDVALKTNKRTAGSQVKWTTDEEIAIRNIADSAYEDLSIGLLTTSGNISGAGTANVLSGAPVASATSALLRLGAANTGGSASGGFISVNSATGYAGDFIRILLDGVARLTLSNAGNLVTAGTITGTAIAGTTGTFSAALSSTTASHTGAMNMNSQLINNVLDPVSAQDAATRSWVLTQVATTSPIWGDGSDGAVTISAPTTLTRDMYYTTLTVNAGNTLTTAGFRVFASTSITINGTVTGAGGNGAAGATGAAGGAGGAAGAATRGSMPSIPGKAGGAGSASGAGTAGTAGTAAVVGATGAIGSAGGAGGTAGGGNTGGAAGAAGAVTVVHTIRDSITAMALSLTETSIFANAGSGSGGGGGGSGGGSTGGGGGGSGANGFTMLFVTPTLTWGGSSTLLGTGGNGANGGAGAGDPSGGGGGSAGGSGSIAIFVYTSKTGSPNTTTLTGGTGGTGGAAGGTGVAGGNGAAGAAGYILNIDV